MKLFSLLLIVFFAAETRATTYVLIEDQGPHSSSLNHQLSAEDLRLTPAQPLAPLLSSIPGLESLSHGGQGQLSALQYQGANADRSIVFLDGVLLNDPSHPSNGFDFSTLLSTDVASVKIISGPEVLLYGVSSAAVVIDIRTKQKINQEFGLNLKPDRSYGLNAKGAMSVKQVDLFLRGGDTQTQGPSAAGAGDKTLERDPSRHLQGQMSVNYTLSDNDSLVFDLKQNQLLSQIDDGPGESGDDPNAFSKKVTTLFSSSYYHQNESQQTTELTLNHQSSERDLKNNVDNLNSTEFKDQYKSRRSSLGLKQSYRLNEQQNLSWALEQQKESIDGSTEYFGSRAVLKEKNASLFGLSVFHQYDSSHFFTELALRGEQHSPLNTSYLLGGAKLGFKTPLGIFAGQVRNSYKVPSLYQQHSIYGDKKLKAEEGTHYSFSHLLRWSETFSSELELYKNNWEKMIGFGAKYENIGRASTQGLSSSLLWQPSKSWSFNYTANFLLPKDDELKQLLIRRALYTHALGSKFSREAFECHLKFYMKGPRSDIDDNGDKVRMAPFERWDFYSGYRWRENTELLFSVENILNLKYQEIWGYSTDEQSFTLGLRVSL